MGAIQRRRGPNVVGFMGLLQPLADGLKLFAKETTIPTSADTNVFISASICFEFTWLGRYSFSEGIVLVDLNLGILYLLAVSSLNIYGILLAGWSSNSKYAYLGALRSAAQMISYEISIGFTVLSVVVCAGSFNF
jgi:NADH-quinone oxidoreductase subunit H